MSVKYTFTCDIGGCDHAEERASESLPPGWMVLTRSYVAEPYREVITLHACSIECASRGVKALEPAPPDIAHVLEVRRQAAALPPAQEGNQDQ